MSHPPDNRNEMTTPNKLTINVPPTSSKNKPQFYASNVDKKICSHLTQRKVIRNGTWMSARADNSLRWVGGRLGGSAENGAHHVDRLKALE